MNKNTAILEAASRLEAQLRRATAVRDDATKVWCLILASLERLVPYYRAMLKFCEETPEMRNEPDLDVVLDFGWALLRGQTAGELPDYGVEDDADNPPYRSDPLLFRVKGVVFDAVHAIEGDTATRNGRFLGLRIAAVDLPSEFIDYEFQGYVVGDRPSEFHRNAFREDVTWALGIGELDADKIRWLQRRSRKARDGFSFRMLE